MHATTVGAHRLSPRGGSRTLQQWEIIPWVQSFGPLAELVAPVGWRQALRENVEAMRARYG